jgi:predicted nuclease of predicted toxin-antitoxin system
VRLLFDQNLSFRLAERLTDVYPGSGHVRLLGLDQVDDREIWDFAARQGFTIVSKDADFQQLAMLLGPPPKVIWIRLGNCQATAVEALLRQGASAVAEFLADPGLAILALPVQLVQ